LEQAADFDIIGFQSGSTIIELEAPPLAEAVPEKFAQQSLFGGLDTSNSAFKVFEESFEDAISGVTDSDRFDDALLQTYAKLNSVFAEGIESFTISNGSFSSPQILVTQQHIESVRTLRRDTPPAQATRIAGRMNTIRHSDKMFELVVQSGETLRGVAPSDFDQLADLFGKDVVVVGKVVFRPSGSVLRIESTKIEPITGNIALWSKAPKARKHGLITRNLRVHQGPQSGLLKIWGQWPGDETDEQIHEALGT
jgi:hypothetical protein